MNPCRIAIIGLGKITEDQHLPVIAGNPHFELVAVASQRGLQAKGAKSFRRPADMYRDVPGIEAVVVCTPPQVRHAYAHEALAAGKHVMLEKPPTATLAELADLKRLADEKQRVLFTTWHSQYNAGVSRGEAPPQGPRRSRPWRSTGGRTSNAGIPARSGSGRRAASASSIPASTRSRS